MSGKMKAEQTQMWGYVSVEIRCWGILFRPTLSPQRQVSYLRHIYKWITLSNVPERVVVKFHSDVCFNKLLNYQKKVWNVY